MKKLLFFAGMLIIAAALFYFYPQTDFFEKTQYRSPQVPDQTGQLKESFSSLEPQFIYKSYDVKSGNIIDQSFVIIKDLPLGKKAIRWSIENDQYVHEDLYILDADYSTQKWRIFLSDEDTDYAGQRNGNELLFKGKLKGKIFDKTIKLDDKPFYYNPKANLTKFVLSNKDKMKFWSLRNDDLTKYLMRAIKKGEEIINVNGKDIETVKVYYSAVGIGEKFFNRTYYFRRADGIFVTQDETNGWKSDLVFEK